MSDDEMPLLAWQREVLDRIRDSDAERITLIVPHRQGRAALYAVTECHLADSAGGTSKTPTE